MVLDDDGDPEIWLSPIRSSPESVIKSEVVPLTGELALTDQIVVFSDML